MGMRQLFEGSRAPKKLTHTHASIIWGVYTAKIIDGYGCVNYLGGLQPQIN